MIRFLVGALLCVAVFSPADAAPICDNNGRCWTQEGQKPETSYRSSRSRAAQSGGAAWSDAPPGCPKRLFCGCDISLTVFGKIVPELKLAANWIRLFQRAPAAPGNVAFNWRRGGGHVVYLKSHISGTIWLVRNPNTWVNGRKHQTVIEELDIRGRIVVNPHMPRSRRFATLSGNPVR